MKTQLDYALEKDEELEAERRREERYWQAYDNRTAQLNASAIMLSPDLYSGVSLMDQMLEVLLGKPVYIVLKNGEKMSYATLKAFDSEYVLLYAFLSERLVYNECVLARSEIKLISHNPCG